ASYLPDPTGAVWVFPLAMPPKLSQEELIMNRLGFSILAVMALAFTSAAQSANQQYRSNQDQDHSRPAQETKTSPSTSNQIGSQGAASASASGSANASANAGGTSA